MYNIKINIKGEYNTLTTFIELFTFIEQLLTRR